MTYDLKRELKHLYAPKQQFALVEVPPLNYLMVDGQGDPNTAPAYREAVEALYRASYAARKAAGQKHVVAPLEDSGGPTTSVSSPPATRAPGSGR